MIIDLIILQDRFHEPATIKALTLQCAKPGTLLSQCLAYDPKRSLPGAR